MRPRRSKGGVGRLVGLLVALASGLPWQLSAQEPVGADRPAAGGCVAGAGPVHAVSGWSAGGLRVAELLGEVPSRSRLSQTAATLEAWRCPGAPEGVAPAATLVRVIANTHHPVERNNGALWGGRGVNVALQGGVEASSGRLSAAVAPVVAGHQNRAFALRTDHQGVSPFAYPWWPRNIDWPQRFGEEPFWIVEAGESYVRLDVGALTLALSSENLWWGPATRYPLLLSNTAAGFPHLSFTVPRPLWIGIGYLEAQMLWGLLDESGFFNHDPTDDSRVLTGVAVSYRPSFFDGLHLGVSALHHQTPEGGRLRNAAIFDIFTNPISMIGGNVAGNALGSVFFRWILVESRFEVYGEWGREDHAWDLNDVISEPSHSQGWMLGLAKAAPLASGWLRLSTEIINLRTAEGLLVNRGAPVWYIHGDPSQGHTHRGQLLGSFVGPGSDAQYLAVDWFGAEMRTGVFLERIRWDADAYLFHWARSYGFHGHDVELAAGLRHGRRFGSFFLEGTVAGMLRRNRNFVNLDRLGWDFPWRSNAHFDIVVGWYGR